MATYSSTKKIWVRLYNKGNYARATNQAKHIETSKFLVETYGPRMVGCQIFCELGVGCGRNIYYFHEKYPEWEYIGNDINPKTYEDMGSVYPNVLKWASIEIIDSLSYLQRDIKMDVTFTHGHLMHIPDDVIGKLCSLIAQKTDKYILLNEAFLNEKGVGLIKRWRYRRYRFDRDYEGMFPGFELEEKVVFSHPWKKGIRYGRYFFKKDGT